METAKNPKVVAAEQLDGGVVVSFDDGRTVLYSTELLLSVLGSARVLPEEE